MTSTLGATTTADATTTATGATSIEPSTTALTTSGPATTADANSATSASTSASEAGSSTTEPVPSCEDGAFAGDAPPLGAPVQIATFYNLQGVELVDVDDDGHADVLVSDFGSGDPTAESGVYLLQGDGTGGFGPPTRLPGGSPTVRIAAAAISDTTVDVVGMIGVLPNYSPAVQRWRGNGDGTFLAPDVYTEASDWDVALVDIDGDGRRDLLGTSNTGARVSIANASEAFGPWTDYGGEPALNGIKGADLDGDGDGDIVTAFTEQLRVLLGNGDGTFAEPLVYPVEGRPIDVLIGDFDGDGAVDIGATWDAIVLVLNGDGRGGWDSPTELTVQGTTLAAATPDFDDDGCSDIVVFNNTGSVSTIMGRAGFMFTAQEVFNIAPQGYPYDVAAGDVDSDGIADVVAVTAGEGEVFLLRSGG